MHDMPEEPLNIARFDHVNASGDLVFEAMNRHFRVRVTDALERGILEAKQVRAEREGLPQPQAASALPISQIQSMIRAGIAPERVAQQFGIAEALVRRFAAPVETEKKYAIDQFLSMPTSKNARSPRPNAEVIAEALLTARIGMDELSWRATRRHHEPWRIEATFETSGRLIRADWSWNMRDNTVVALNATAKRLLGQSAQPIAGVAAPGSAAASARMPQALVPGAPFAPVHPSPGTGSPTGESGPDAAAASDGSEAGRTVASGATSMQVTAAGGEDAGRERGHGSNPLTAWLYGASEAAVGHAGSVASDGPTATSEASSASATSEASDAQTTNGGAQDGSADAAADTANTTGTANTAKRRSGRSAVPSWDEILFGE